MLPKLNVMRRSHRSCLIAASLLLATSLSLPAQQAAPAPPQTENPLDTILTALEANLQDYLHSVPSFLCNEHVVSEMEPTPTPGGSTRMVTEAVFRVRHSTEPGERVKLSESRVLKTVDGKPPGPGAAEETTEFTGPMAVFGIFSGGLELVSLTSKACFRYRLHPTRKGHPSDKIVIDFEVLPLRERDPACPYEGTTSGRAFIQPPAMRVTRLETKTPDHEVKPGEKETWEWSVDYAPVSLSEKIFWMPSKIRSKAVPDQPANATTFSPSASRRGNPTIGTSQARPLTYTLEAKYSDYHLLHVASRIVPTPSSEEQPAPSPPEP